MNFRCDSLASAVAGIVVEIVLSVIAAVVVEVDATTAVAVSSSAVSQTSDSNSDSQLVLHHRETMHLLWLLMCHDYHHYFLSSSVISSPVS